MAVLEVKYKFQFPDENGRYWIETMNLFLGVWLGTREGRNGYWLRWWDDSGELLLWNSELAERERQRAERFAPVADLLELSAICWNNQVDWLVISHPILDSVVKTHYLC